MKKQTLIVVAVLVLLIAGAFSLHWLRSKQSLEEGVPAPDLTVWRQGIAWRSVEVNGYNASYAIMPGSHISPTLVFAPGLASSFDLVGPFLAELNQSGYTIVLFPYRGQPGDGNTLHDYAIDQLTNDLRVFLDRIEVKGKFVLVGQSFGGIVAIDYTLKYPERVRRLILLDTFAYILDFRRKVQTWLISNMPGDNPLFKLAFAGHNVDELYTKEDAKRWSNTGPVDPKWVEDLLHDIVDKTSSATLRDRVIVSTAADYRSRMQKIQVPVLTVTGYYDKLTGTSHQYELAKAPNSIVTYIPDTGHHHCTTKPRETALVIQRFLSIPKVLYRK